MLVQNCGKSYFLVELTQILVPKKTAEPYRNFKNHGILVDLHKIFGNNKFIDSNSKLTFDAPT